MQETQTVGPVRQLTGPLWTSCSLAALLALAGSKKLDAAALRSRMKLTGSGFDALLGWLQQEYLVDLVSSLEGETVRETVQLTERGEGVLIALLEQTCELPELH